MSQKSDDPQSFDPFGAWQTMRDASADAWVKLMLQVVNFAEEENPRSTRKHTKS